MLGRYPFKNYEEFKELFVREDGRRKNAVLLRFLMSKDVRKYCIETGLYYALKFRTMSELKDFVIDRMRYGGYKADDGYSINFLGWNYYNAEFYSDGSRGLCEDRDYKSYRYCRVDTGRVFKMKAGRMFARILDNSKIGDIIPNEVKLWMCEEMQNDWEQYAKEQLPPIDDCELFVNDDFERIYNGRYLLGDFGSCMTNRGHHTFYENSVKAKAAYIERGDGMILARCVIFTEVRDDNTGEVFRLAERQYSSEGKEAYKHDLIRMLKAGGHIDGYKKIGAGCGEADAFVDLDGNSMSGRPFSIECTASGEDMISYQDSFKWYDMDNSRAYNYDDCNYEYDLATTEEYLDPGNYDEYHEEYTHNDLQEVYYGRWMMCDEDRLDDFYYIEGEGYIHEDYCTYCEQCDEYFREGCGYHSDITGEDYCCESCLEEAEREYKEENWHYSEYDDEYFEDEDDVVTLKRGTCDEISICIDSVNRLVESGEVICINGKYYDADWASEVLDEA